MLKQGVLREGNMLKKKFFVALEEKRLVFYREDKKTVSDEVQLSMIITIAPSEKDKKAFNLKTSSRSLRLYAENNDERDAWVTAISNQKNEPSGVQKKVTQDDFEIIALVGKGNFGKVFQVKKKDTGEVFALKVLYKQHIVESNETIHTMAEKSILQRIRHPFLVNLHYSFQNETKLFLVLDFVNGGELFYHLQQDNRFPEDRARFYAAEILLGLEHLHQNGIAYRDLKLENLLLAPDGHIRITDFGLSKEGLHSEEQSTRTFCGTPEYMAPEMLQGKGYNKAVDWWSFGSLVYEMISGLPPFYSQDVQQMYRKIIKEELTFNDLFSDEAKNFLSLLLVKDPTKRLVDTKTMKSHPFFSGLNWDLLFQKKIDPPFIPDVQNAYDLSNIDESFTVEKPEIGNADANLTKDDQKQFSGFTYVPDADK